MSARAKRATLRVSPDRGLVVTIPSRFPRRDVAGFVARHRDWVLAELAALEARVPPEFRQWPPRGLVLPATGKRVIIGYELGARRAPGSSLDGESVVSVGCDPADRQGVAAVLAAHLAGEARRHLVPRLAALAAAHGLRYARCSVRGQRTLWGSCSSSGTISLNWKLLFLRPGLVDHVLLHELAHTRHMNHSPAFWALLERLCPGARALDAELSEAGARVPPWFG